MEVRIGGDGEEEEEEVVGADEVEDEVEKGEEDGDKGKRKEDLVLFGESG